MKWKKYPFIRSSFLMGCVFLCTFIAGQAQPPAHTPKFSPVIDNNINGFWEYLPRNYESDVNTVYPLLIFFHGAGEQGSEPTMASLNKVLRSGPPKLINSGNFPDSFFVSGRWHKYIVLSPQIKNGISGNSSIIQPSTIDALIQYAQTTYRVDPGRIYLCGLSMGGGATWDYAGSSVAAAGKLAAITVACGAGDVFQQEGDNIAASNLPVLATHNAPDVVVSIDRTKNNIAQIMTYTPAISPAPRAIYWDNGGHNAWTRTFEELQPGATPGGNVRDSLGMSVYEWFLQFIRPAAALPVAWESFIVRPRNGQAMLQWIVNAQLNAKEYIVEKSRDAVQWTSISSVAAVRGTNRQQYLFNDPSTSPGITYYRVKEVDMDGRYSYSSIKKFDPGMRAKVVVYPNPFMAEIRIDADLPAENIFVRLTDVSGKTLVWQKHRGGNAQREVVLQNVSGLASGTYFLTIKNEAGQVLYTNQLLKK